MGGQGGSISFVAKDNLTLEKVASNNRKQRIIAQHGRNSTHNFICGLPAENITVEVPVGVTVLTDSGKSLGRVKSLR